MNPRASNSGTAVCRTWTELLADRYARHPWLCDVKPTGMPTGPRAYAWIDSLVAAVADDAPIDALRLAMLLDGLVRSFAALERSTNSTHPPAWLGEAVAARFPRLAGAEQQDVTDVRAELRYAVDVVLRGTSRGPGSSHRAGRSRHRITRRRTVELRSSHRSHRGHYTS